MAFSALPLHMSLTSAAHYIGDSLKIDCSVFDVVQEAKQFSFPVMYLAQDDLTFQSLKPGWGNMPVSVGSYVRLPASLIDEIYHSGEAQLTTIADEISGRESINWKLLKPDVAPVLSIDDCVIASGDLNHWLLGKMNIDISTNLREPKFVEELIVVAEQRLESSGALLEIKKALSKPSELPTFWKRGYQGWVMNHAEVKSSVRYLIELLDIWYTEYYEPYQPGFISSLESKTSTNIGWKLNKVERFPGYRRPLYDFLEAAQQAGKPLPTSHDVCKAWSEERPNKIHKVTANGIEYYTNSKMETKEADHKAIREAIKGLVSIE